MVSFIPPPKFHRYLTPGDPKFERVTVIGEHPAVELLPIADLTLGS